MAMFTAGGCSGDIQSGDSNGGSPTTGGAPTSGVGTTGPKTTPTEPPSGQATEPGGLRRLTTEQYRNTIHDLLGADITVPSELEPDVALGGFASVGAAQTPISPVGVERFEAASYDIARQALGSASWRERAIPCAAASLNEECARNFISAFGRRAFRRPVSEEELRQYVALFVKASSQTGDPSTGLTYVLAALLQSPSFLFRIELGAPDRTGKWPYDSYEMATRLSYFLVDTTPSDALLDLAAKGGLATVEQVKREAEKLIASPQARANLADFFLEMLALEGVDSLTKDATAFPQMTPALAGAMKRETQLFFTEMVIGSDRGVFAGMLDGRETFVDTELAKLYGLTPPGGAGLVRVPFPAGHPRIGLGVLGQASFLAGHAHENETSPTRRGMAIRRDLLCQPIPEAPPNTDTTLPPVPVDGTGKTMRQRLKEHATNDTCATCHNFMDPIGLALENFDAIGAYREKDGKQTIDPSGELDGASFTTPAELAGRLREHPRAATCLVRQLYRFATGQVEGKSEEPLLGELETVFGRDQFRFAPLVAALVQSDGFRLAAPSRK